MLGFIPLRYNIRNLGQRRLRTGLTVIGIALAVFVCILMYAFSEGMENSLRQSSYSENAVILNANAQHDLTRSRIDKAVADIVAASIGGVKEIQGQRLVSPEVHLGTNVSLDGTEGVHLGIVRGVKPIAFRVHPQVEIIDGTEFAQGRKVIVGRLVATKLGIPDEDLYIGRKIVFEEDEWEISGIFQAPGTVFESEIWCDADDLIISTKREEYSAISLTLNGMETFDDVDYFCRSRLNMEIRAWKEISFYGKVAETFRPITLLVRIMVVMVALGGIITGSNTMYTAVLGRFREFGMLRTLGFGRFSILIGLFLESILLAGMGGILGAAAARFANGISLRYPMGAFSFTIDFEVLVYGFCLALIIGVFGAVVPGLRGLRMKLIDSIRAL